MERNVRRDGEREREREEKMGLWPCGGREFCFEWDSYRFTCNKARSPNSSRIRLGISNPYRPQKFSEDSNKFYNFRSILR